MQGPVEDVMQDLHLGLSITWARAERELWSLATPFRISRGIQSDVELVVVELESGAVRGRGECCPVAHFGETPGAVLGAIDEALSALKAGAEWESVHDGMGAGAARNAVDSAMWDLRAKSTGQSIWNLVGIPAPAPRETVMTISLDEPAVMARVARAAETHAMLKLKLGAVGDIERVVAVRHAVPDKRLIADVNEGWDIEMLRHALPALRELGVEMIEQPLPVGQDEALRDVERTVPLGADESCHVVGDLDRLVGLYDVVNIKLDKTGGLTEALRLQARAHTLGLDTMVGCMLGTSLGMAPGMIVAQGCRYVDLDAPLLMGKDRTPALDYSGGCVGMPDPVLWG